jgi:hypothetical protein
LFGCAFERELRCAELDSFSDPDAIVVS